MRFGLRKAQTQILSSGCSSLSALLLPGAASPAYSFNLETAVDRLFPEPVTPIARKTLHIHNEFMLITTTLFVAVSELSRRDPVPSATDFPA